MSRKELVYARTGPWWGQEDNLSHGFVAEVAAMKAKFSHTWQSWQFPKTDWDKNNFLLFTQKISLIPQHSDGLSFVWMIKFMMDDNNYLSTADQVFTMYVVYPDQYPQAPPRVVMIHSNGKNLFDRTWGKVTINQQRYQVACQNNHSSGTFTGHNPGFTSALIHAIRGVAWLRAKLYAKKEGKEMPHYG